MGPQIPIDAFEGVRPLSKSNGDDRARKKLHKRRKKQKQNVKLFAAPRSLLHLVLCT